METGSTEFEREDVSKNKDMAALGYVLFFLPLITCKDSKLGRACANQGLLLLLVYVVAQFILGIFDNIFLIGFLFGIAKFLVSIGLIALGIFMAVQLRKYGRVMKLPYIGQYTLIK
jgi:hypothetical protein